MTRPVVAIYTSPIPRAQQTAQILAEVLPLPLHQSGALAEFDCGIMEGRRDQEAWEAHNAVIQAWDERQDYDQRIAEGESFRDMQARFVPFIEQLRADYTTSEGDVVLISHGSLLLQMLPLVLTNIDRAFTQTHPLGNCAWVIAGPRSEGLVCLEWDGIRLG
jgi:broad specificity phosphatase PhoE